MKQYWLYSLALIIAVSAIEYGFQFDSVIEILTPFFYWGVVAIIYALAKGVSKAMCEHAHNLTRKEEIKILIQSIVVSTLASWVLHHHFIDENKPDELMSFLKIFAIFIVPAIWGTVVSIKNYRRKMSESGLDKYYENYNEFLSKKKR